jgi:hypothetical protein
VVLLVEDVAISIFLQESQLITPTALQSVQHQLVHHQFIQGDHAVSL